MTAPNLPDDLDGLRAAVLAWFDVERRDLPFRRTRDPYLVLVSEAMAQQTQIGRVAPAWERFVALFPTVESLAAAPLDEVLRAWAGLGYNRRAVSLHRAAKAVVAEHGGRIPADPGVLETLPGVGPYTARAVAAIAFGRPVGAVDTNVRRVLTRVAGLDGSDGRAVQALADAAVAPDRPGEWTAALMDVGARYCRATPRCESCPANRWCVTARAARTTGQGGPRSHGGTVRSAPFPSTRRWLRGRVVAVLREAPLGWHRFDAPLGAHDRPALVAALAGLARDGLVEIDPCDPLRARLARGEPLADGPVAGPR